MHAPHAAASNTPLAREAMEPFWLPMTPNRQYKSKPRLFVGAEGMRYTTQDGRQILDGMAGLWSMPDTAKSGSSRRSRRRQRSSISSPRSR